MWPWSGTGTNLQTLCSSDTRLQQSRRVDPRSLAERTGRHPKNVFFGSQWKLSGSDKDRPGELSFDGAMVPASSNPPSSLFPVPLTWSSSHQMFDASPQLPLPSSPGCGSLVCVPPGPSSQSGGLSPHHDPLPTLSPCQEKTFSDLSAPGPSGLCPSTSPPLGNSSLFEGLGEHRTSSLRSRFHLVANSRSPVVKTASCAQRSHGHWAPTSPSIGRVPSRQDE